MVLLEQLRPEIIHERVVPEELVLFSGVPPRQVPDQYWTMTATVPWKPSSRIISQALSKSP